MELKKKFHSFFQRIGKEDEADIGVIHLPDLPRRRTILPDEEVNAYPTDPAEDEEILNKIDLEFFQEDLNASLYELEKLPVALNRDTLIEHRQMLLKQLTVVTKKVFAKILSQQTACSREMEKIKEIQNQLQICSQICTGGRKGLVESRCEFTSSSLGILAAYRRRQRMVNLLHDLSIIRTLQLTNVRLQEFLTERDYPSAIQLIIECQKVAAVYQHFSSISQLSSKLRDTMAMTEEALDVTLSKVCTDFNEKLYSSLYEAYGLLDKTQTSMDQLHMHLTSSIHNTAWNVVYGHSVLSGAETTKKPYVDICTLTDPLSILPCLIDLCSALWRIMTSYKQIVNWHYKIKDSNYVEKKLENGLPRIWQDVQTKIRVFVSANDLSVLNIESFLKFMDVIYKLIQVGHEFCGSESDTLQDSLKRQCWNYFLGYHHTRLKELKMFLDNESWKVCPVKSTFKATHLSEFKHLKDVGFGSPMKKTKINLSSQDCPFQNQILEDTVQEDFLVNYNNDDSDNEEPDERLYLEEEGSETISKRRARESPIITNTSLMILRLCGNYLQMMKMLDSISLDIFGSLCQLVEFYAFLVHSFFTGSLSERDRNAVTSFELADRLSQIRNNLFCGGELEPPSLMSHVAESLTDPQMIFGLSEKVVAVESAVFLTTQLQELKPAIKRLVLSDNEDVIEEYYNKSINFTSELRQPVYMTIASHVSDTELILQLMAKVAWDVKEVKSQHSQYVDVLLRELQVFSLRLDDLCQSVQFEISSVVKAEIWKLIVLVSSFTFVDGFANVKKCSNEGRALMQLDYRQFVVKLEKVAELKPIPYQDYVSTYIKAYYISEVELEEWVKHHREYTSQHLVSLVNCVAYNNNRTKQKLNNLINDLSDRIRK